jgi:hypothetical protein
MYIWLLTFTWANRRPVHGELVVLVTLAKMSRKTCEGWTHLGVP